jgi:hypothetical protein
LARHLRISAVDERAPNATARPAVRRHGMLIADLERRMLEERTHINRLSDLGHA